jgi:hypothetical protein
VIARAAGMLLVVAAALAALRAWTLEPLRCARAAWRESAAELRDCDCTPLTVDVCTARGTSYAVSGDAKRAIVEWRRALDLARRPEIYFALGMDALDAFDRPTAITNLTRACAFQPSRLADIPYADVRSEVRERIRAAYGDDWLR